MRLERSACPRQKSWREEAVDEASAAAERALPLWPAAILARSLCATCYTLKRQDRAYFGGLREQVLACDGHRCRACGKAGRQKRALAVHHRRPGLAELAWLITLCPGCHARVSRTRTLAQD